MPSHQYTRCSPAVPEEEPEDAFDGRAGSTLLPWDGGRFTSASYLERSASTGGAVYSMFDIDAGSFVAVKRMPVAWTTLSAAEFARAHPLDENPWTEVSVLAYLNRHGCDFACSLLGTFVDDDFTYIVTSLADGDAFAWSAALVPATPSSLRELLVAPVAAQLLSAVARLHSMGLAHRDVSLENCVLSGGGANTPPRLQLVDFGGATTARLGKAGERRGKETYMAPEMHSGLSYNAFLPDVFAAGVAIFASVLRQPPWLTTEPGVCRVCTFVGKRGLRCMLARKRCGDQWSLDVMSPELVDLLDGLLAFHPDSRLMLGEYEGEDHVWNNLWVLTGLAMARPPPSPAEEAMDSDGDDPAGVEKRETRCDSDRGASHWARSR